MGSQKFKTLFLNCPVARSSERKTKRKKKKKRNVAVNEIVPGAEIAFFDGFAVRATANRNEAGQDGGRGTVVEPYTARSRPRSALDAGWIMRRSE